MAACPGASALGAADSGASLDESRRTSLSASFYRVSVSNPRGMRVPPSGEWLFGVNWASIFEVSSPWKLFETTCCFSPACCEGSREKGGGRGLSMFGLLSRALRGSRGVWA